MLEPRVAEIDERRTENGVAGRHGLLGRGERATQKRCRHAVSPLFAVEEPEGGQAPGEPQVRLAEALSLGDGGGEEPFGVRGPPVLPRAIGRAHQRFPAGGLGGSPRRPEQQREREGPDHRAEGKDGGRFSRIARMPSRTSSPMKVSISRASD